MSAITSIKGIGPDSARILQENGFTSVQAIAEASVDLLQIVPGFGAVRAAMIIKAAATLLERQRDTATAVPKKKTGKEKTEKKKKKGKKQPSKKKKEGKKEKKKKGTPSKKQKKHKKGSGKKKDKK